DLEENINKISYDIQCLEKLKTQLQRKLGRYRDLRLVVEKINKELSLEYVVETLISLAFEIISDKKALTCLYLIDPSTHKPILTSTKKQDDSVVIKSKEGDIFDYWVLKHTQPLLIEDLSKDFRFDIEKIKKDQARPISSLIAAPFVSEESVLGILRLDSQEANFFNQDDLSFLSTLCDLAAVALENAQLYLKTEELAIHDDLTSLFTKGYFLERLKEEFPRALREKSRHSLMMIDIDYFKAYNDKYGHSAGDAILKNLGMMLNEFFENRDAVVCRFGGEEFAVLLFGVERKEVQDLAEKLRHKIQMQKFIIRRKETFITVSIGTSTLSPEVLDEQDWLKQVDTALYQAKQKGRNRVCHI
ncbi:MAG: sensor domain-containing diguanylate cyclase, partial [Candidatus Omnitrophica bacterium]|nr:sensor domain-containing diguanylate cyclase [Candidatus Omnitrophota bacterium]